MEVQKDVFGAGDGDDGRGFDSLCLEEGLRYLNRRIRIR